LDALHDRGLRRINISIARYAYRAQGVSFLWAVRHCTGLLKISPDFLSNKPR